MEYALEGNCDSFARLLLTAGADSVTLLATLADMCASKALVTTTDTAIAKCKMLEHALYVARHVRPRLMSLDCRCFERSQ